MCSEAKSSGEARVGDDPADWMSAAGRRPWMGVLPGRSLETQLSRRTFFAELGANYSLRHLRENAVLLVPSFVHCLVVEM
ncbi:MAG: hypothetical protein Q7J85_02795 [Bacillota bacterium]|nr:hypothetical protein [Bacillota bacterium]